MILKTWLTTKKAHVAPSAIQNPTTMEYIASSEISFKLHIKAPVDFYLVTT